MLKKVKVLGVVIMALGLFVGCGIDKGIAFRISKSGISVEGVDHPIITKLVKSVDELEQLCDENKLIADEQKYSAIWFESNALVILSFVEKSSSIDYQVESVKVKDEILTVYMTRLVPKKGILLGTTKNELILIEVNQADVTQVNSIEISSKNKNK